MRGFASAAVIFVASWFSESVRVSHKHKWNGPYRGVGAREIFMAFRKKTSFSFVRMNVLHHVERKAPCSMSVLKCGWMSISNKFLFFTAVIELSAFVDAFVKTFCQTVLIWNASRIMHISWTDLFSQHGNHEVFCQSSCECLQLHQIFPSIIHGETGMNQKKTTLPHL